MSHIDADSSEQRIVVNSANTGIYIESSTQRIVVNPLTRAVAIVNAGPIGPRGLPGPPGPGTTLSDDIPFDLGEASPGESEEVSRADHVHRLPVENLVPSPAGQDDGNILVTYEEELIYLPFPEPAAPLSDDNPENLGETAPGVSTEGSRSDHVHALPTAEDINAIPQGGPLTQFLETSGHPIGQVVDEDTFDGFFIGNLFEGEAEATVSGVGIGFNQDIENFQLPRQGYFGVEAPDMFGVIFNSESEFATATMVLMAYPKPSLFLTIKDETGYYQLSISSLETVINNLSGQLLLGQGSETLLPSLAVRRMTISEFAGLEEKHEQTLYVVEPE